MPPSERGGVIVSFILRARVKLWLWRSLGDLPGFLEAGFSAVSEWFGGAGRSWVLWRWLECRAWVMLLLMAAASKGAPTSSGVVRRECCELAAEGPAVSEKAGFEVCLRRSEGGSEVVSAALVVSWRKDGYEGAEGARCSWWLRWLWKDTGGPFFFSVLRVEVEGASIAGAGTSDQ